jgi:Flp pilus assembly pilin Flp
VKSFVETARWLYANEDGQAIVEYALLLSLISLVCILVITALGQRVAVSYSRAQQGLP